MAKRDPNPNSALKVFTDAFLKKLAVPKGKTSNGKERKDIVIFEPRSGLGVRKQAETGVTSFLIQLRLPDGRRWRETLRPPYPHLSLADARAALQVRTGDIARGLDPYAEREAAAAEREAKREAEAAAKAKAEADQFTLRMLLREWDHLALVHRRKSYAVKALRSIEKTFPKMIDLPVARLTAKRWRPLSTWRSTRADLRQPSWPLPRCTRCTDGPRNAASSPTTSCSAFRCRKADPRASGPSTRTSAAACSAPLA